MTEEGLRCPPNTHSITKSVAIALDIYLNVGKGEGLIASFGLQWLAEDFCSFVDDPSNISGQQPSLNNLESFLFIFM